MLVELALPFRDLIVVRLHARDTALEAEPDRAQQTSRYFAPVDPAALAVDMWVSPSDLQKILEEPVTLRT